MSRDERKERDSPKMMRQKLKEIMEEDKGLMKELMLMQ